MHVALIIDEERLQREQAMLNRLVVALVDDGAQITRVLPQSIDMGEARKTSVQVGLTPCVVTPMRVMPWGRRQRSQALVASFEKSLPELIHAIGSGAWPVAMDLGLELEKPTTLDIWSAAQMDHLPHGRGASQIAGFIVPTQPMASALSQRLGSELVTLIPPGVGKQIERAPILSSVDQSASIAIIGSGSDITAYYEMLEGLRQVLVQYPQVQAFLELRGPHEHEIWRHVQRLNLGGQVTAITDAAQHRSLIMRCDILMVPERQGEVYSLVLEVMAGGVAVIAADDPWQDTLLADTTAHLIRDSLPEHWARSLRTLLDRPDEARALGQSAQAWVTTNRRSSDQATQLLTALQRVLDGGSLAFAKPA